MDDLIPSTEIVVLLQLNSFLPPDDRIQPELILEPRRLFSKKSFSWENGREVFRPRERQSAGTARRASSALAQMWTCLF
jgi:hypothetical protein